MTVIHGLSFDDGNVSRSPAHLLKRPYFLEPKSSLASLVPEGGHLGFEPGVYRSDRARSAVVHVAQFLPF